MSGIPLLTVGRAVNLARMLQHAASDASKPRDALASIRSGTPWPSARVTATASADTQVIKALRGLDVPTRFGQIVSGLATAFSAEGRALAELAQADSTKNAQRYAAASRAITQADHKLETIGRLAIHARLLRTAFPGLKAPGWTVVVSANAPTGTGTLVVPTTRTHAPQSGTGGSQAVTATQIAGTSSSSSTSKAASQAAVGASTSTSGSGSGAQPIH